MTLLIVSIVMGIVTFIIGTSATIPQLISLIKTRNTSGISLTSYIICNIDDALWLVWTFGFYFNSMYMYDGNNLRLYQISLLILVIAYTFGSILVAGLLVIKINHLLKAKALKVTELQLAKILLDKDKKKYFINKKWNNFFRYLPLIIFIVLNALFTSAIVVVLYIFGYVTPIKGEEEWLWVIILGFMCSIVWEITYWPQVIKSIREKDMTGISLFWAIFGSANAIINFIYDLTLAFSGGSFTYDMIFILIFSAILPNLIILALKIRNVVNAKKAGMSELEYTKKVLIPRVKDRKKAKN